MQRQQSDTRDGELAQHEYHQPEKRPGHEAVRVQAHAEHVDAEHDQAVMMLPSTASTAMPRCLIMPPSVRAG